ncbi:MAG: hypothetical protein MJ181_04515 [Treponema sp.]|nr:hypothetical protein [Treponema sp.]
MKKLMKVVLLVSAALVFASCGSTPKAEEVTAGPVKLDPQALFDFEGVRAESINWANARVTINGMIVWSWAMDADCYETGWDLRGVDLSGYDGIRIELEEPQEMKILLANNPGNKDCWAYEFDEKGVCYAPFDGVGNIWGAESVPDLTKGFEIKLQVPPKKYLTTQIKSVVVYRNGKTSKKANAKNEKIVEENVNSGDDLVVDGVRLGSHVWQSRVSGNVITWKKSYDNADAGWDFTGMDLSVYDRVRVEIESTDAPVHLRFADKDWNLSIGFPETEKNVFEAKLTGEGSWEYEGEPMYDLSKGLRIYLNQWNDNVVRAEDKTTVVKSIQFLKPGEVADAGPVGLMGRGFGGIEDRCEVQDKTVIWKKGSNDANAGWNLSGIDLSVYDSVRITLEKTDVLVDFVVTDKNQGKWKFARKTDSNVYEMKLTGEGANSEEPLIDKSEGVRFFVHFYSDQPLKKDCTTVVKKIELLKESAKINEQFMLVGKELGSSGYRSFTKDNGLIEWEWDKKEKYPFTGWNFRDTNLSAYNVIRVEIETTDVPVDIRLVQDGCHIGFKETKPGVIEARFDGQGCDWMWEEKGPWDPSKKIEEIHIRADNLSKSGKKTVIKSVQLLNEEEKVQPESIRIGDVKLGSKKDNAWLDDDFVINWEKADYNQCGWKLEKVAGDVLEVEVSSTEVPVRLRVREYASGNEASWEDDGSHVFRIQLDTRKMESKNGLKNPEWIKKTKDPDYSQGCEIILEATNPRYSGGKKTVVESVWIKSWEEILR